MTEQHHPDENAFSAEALAQLVAIEGGTRTWVAESLHDETVQLLAAISMQAHYVRSLPPERVPQALETLETITGQLTDQFQRFLQRLRCDLGSAMDIGEELRSYLCALPCEGRVELHVHLDPVAIARLSDGSAWAVRRILQETLHLTRRAVTRVEVTGHALPDASEFKVVFSSEREKADSLEGTSLTKVAERVALWCSVLGARLILKRRSDHELVIGIRLPWVERTS